MGASRQRRSFASRAHIEIEARALATGAPVVILDEPTSALDVETEASLLDALDRLTNGRTTFVIAHRLSTIRNADQVLVLDRGKIIERGTHSELLAKKGFYFDLYMSQFRRKVDAEEGQEEAHPVEDAFFVPGD